MKQLSEYILDIAENSIRANADRIDITLRESGDTSAVEMLVRDDGDGMIEELCSLVGNVRFTTKDGGGGLGLVSLKTASEQCGGSFSLESKLGAGTIVRASFDKAFPSYPPVGDIAATLMTLIAGAHGKRIVFRHELASGKTIVFDTDRVKAALGDELLSEPRVLLLIRDHIKEAYGSDYSELFQKG